MVIALIPRKDVKGISNPEIVKLVPSQNQTEYLKFGDAAK